MRGKRRTIAAAAALALLLGLCTGCNESESRGVVIYEKADSVEAEVELAFFGFKADAMNLTAIEESLHGFMSENSGIIVTYEGLKGGDYWSAFDKRVAADVLDDVVMIDHDHVLELGAQGKLADLSDISTISNFTELAQGQFINEDGTVRFLPTCISTYGLYINYDLLEKHGQKIPENYAEFASVCDYFVGQGITPIVANYYASLSNVIEARGLFETYQSDDAAALIERYNSGETRLEDVLRPGVELVCEMRDRGWFDAEEVLATSQTSDDLQIFAEGERPFMITGGWASPRLAAMNSELSYGVHPFPILADGSVLVTNVDTCVAVSASGAHVAEAKKFVEYLTTTDVLWNYCASQSSYTPLLDDRTPPDETILPSSEYITNGRSVIGTDYRLDLPLFAALSRCSDEILNGADAESAVALIGELLY